MVLYFAGGEMNLKNKKYFFVIPLGIVSLGILLFQNCSKVSFGVGPAVEDSEQTSLEVQCVDPRPDDLQVEKQCSLLGSTYSGTFFETTPFICVDKTWVLGSLSNNSATSCLRNCALPKPTDKVDIKNCSDLGSTYVGTYNETTPYQCSTSSYTWVFGSKSNNSATSCSQSCSASAKPLDQKVTKACSLLGDTYFGTYTETTPMICSGTSWVLATTRTDDSSTACQRNCNASKPADSVVTLACSDLLGKNYEGSYKETTPMVCSKTSWSWGAGVKSNTSSTDCRIRAGVCGPNAAAGVWIDDHTTNLPPWCEVGEVRSITGNGQAGAPFRWSCQVSGGTATSCSAKLCTSVALKAGHVPLEPPQDSVTTMLSQDSVAGLQTLIRDTKNGSYNLILGCNGCSSVSDAPGKTASDAIHSASNYNEFLAAIQNAIVGRGVQTYFNVTKGNSYTLYGYGSNGARFSMVGDEVVLTLKDTSMYFAPASTNAWFVLGAAPSGNQIFSVECR